MEKPLHPRADLLAKFRLQLALDDERDTAEACAVGVIQGKVDDKMTLGIDRRDLLEPAETAAHARGHNDKGRLIVHKIASFFFFCIVTPLEEKSNAAQQNCCAAAFFSRYPA